MGKGSVLLLAGVATLLLVAAMAFWVLRMGQDYGEFVQGGRGGATVVAPRGATPEARDLPELPALPEAASADARPLEPTAAGPAPAPDAAGAEAGEPVAVSGRVLDAAGAPVAGARVHLLPSLRMRKLLGLPISAFEGGIERSRLAATTSDAEGRFTLEGRDLRQPEAALVDRSDNVVYGSDGRWPELLVEHPAHATASFPCTNWRGGPHAAGDLVLAAGATLKGRVVDESGRPLAGATAGVPLLAALHGNGMTMEGLGLRSLLRSAAGDDGRFLLPGLPEGELPFEFRAPGRVTLTRKVQLAAGTETDLGDVLLAAGRALEGRVVTPEGLPVPEARAVVRPASGARGAPGADGDLAAQQLAIRMAMNGVFIDREARTGADGSFRIDGLEADGRGFHVAAGAPGREPAMRAGVSLDDGPVELVLERAATIVLTLLDADGDAPVSGARIDGRRHADDSGWSWSRLEVGSDPAALAAAGEPGPHAGRYLLAPAGWKHNDAIVSAPGFATRLVELPSVRAPGRAVHVERLSREARVTGRVTDAQDAPLAGVALALARVDAERSPSRDGAPDPDHAAATSDAEGRFAFAGLGSGEWELTAVAEGFVRPEPRRLELQAGQSAPEQLLVLQRGGELAGIVLAAGLPQANEGVIVQPAAEAQARRAAEAAGEQRVKHLPRVTSWRVRTGADGRFLLDALPPGDYELSGPPGVQLAARVELGRRTEVELHARARPRVHGVVRDARGPVPGALVEPEQWFEPLEGWMGSFAQVTAGADGAWELELDLPGRYRIGARDAGAATPGVEVELDWDQVVALDLRFGGGELRGRVFDAATGAAVAGARVRVMGTQDGAVALAQPGGTARKLVTDEAGRFEALRLPAGAWGLLVDHADFVQPAPLVVQVQEGAPGAPLDVPLQRAGRVRGTLRSALPGSAPPGNLAVRCVGLEAQGELRAGVDGDRFERHGLLPGRWRIEVAPSQDAAAPALAATEVLVVAGETVELELVLP